MYSIQDPRHKAEIALMIKEYSNAKLQAESHNEHAKEIIADIVEKYEVQKSVVTKAATLYHKQQIAKFREANDDVVDFIDSIFGNDE